MKMSTVDPSVSLTEDVAVIESNSGIENTEAEPEEALTATEKSEARLDEAKVVLENIVAEEALKEASLLNYNVIVNTTVHDEVDTTNLDMTPVLIAGDIDYAGLGLPNPADYGKSPEEVVPLSSVNGSSWNLPKPELSKIEPECLDLSDVFMSVLVDLEAIDMRSYYFAGIDFSWATEWDFPEWLNPANIPVSYLFDLVSIDLSGIIDLSSISIPDWINPVNWFPDWDISGTVAGWYDDLAGFFSDMGSDGDLFAMGTLTSLYNGAKCLTKNIAEICNAEAIGNAICNFNIPMLEDAIDYTRLVIAAYLDDGMSLEELSKFLEESGYSDFDNMSTIFKLLEGGHSVLLSNGLTLSKSDIAGPFMSVLALFGDDWWYYDGDKTKWNYDLLVRMNTTVLGWLCDNSVYDELTHASYGFQTYDDNF